MDVGQGQLQNGRAYITLDPIFAKNIVVNSQHPLRVIHPSWRMSAMACA